MAVKAGTKKAAKKAAFKHDALVIRTVNADDTAYNGFQWPSKVGEIVECPDWNPRAECGNGFHGLLNGIGDWFLTWRGPSQVWQVVGVMRDECVAIDGAKVKFPRGKLLYRGDKAGALNLIVPAMVEAILSSADGNIATGTRGHAAATGDSGHAAATGYSGHAAATGNSGHAAATGQDGIAASLGPLGTATAGPTGYIVLAHWNTDAAPYRLTRVERFKVGEDGVEAGKTYRLSADGKAVLA